MFEGIQYSYAASACWGAILLVSWVGTGSLLARVAWRRDEPYLDWGLRAGWGIAAQLAVGGVLCLAHLAYREVLFGLVVALAAYQVSAWGRGLAAAGVARVRQHSLAHGRVFFIVIVALPLLLTYLSMVERKGTAWTEADDYSAYLPFAKRILDTGSLIAPFHMRRLAAHGGHSLLQAQTLVLGTGRNALLLEGGLAPIVIAGLVWGLFRKTSRFELVVASLLTVLLGLFPLPRTNSHSHETGAVVFLTLLRTLALPDRADGRRWAARPWVVGMITAGAWSLRANYAAASVLAVALAYAGRAWLDGPRSWREHLGGAARAGAGALLVMAPWMLLMQLSSGTPFYPFIAGNQAQHVAYLSRDLGAVETVEYVARAMFYPVIAALCVPLVLVLRRERCGDVLPAYLGAIAGAVLMALAFTYSDPQNLARYSAPPLFAACAAALAISLSDARRRRLRTVTLLMLAGGVVVGGAYSVPRIKRVSERRALEAVRPPGPLFDPQLEKLYERAQQAVPPGEKVLAAVDYPFFLDYRRNDVHTIDGAGMCSPDPGIPLRRGPDAVKQYLRDRQGIRYVLSVDFSGTRQLLSRHEWERTARQEWPYLFVPAHAPYFLTFMDTIDAIERSEEVVFREGNLRVARLRGPDEPGANADARQAAHQRRPGEGGS